MDRGDGWRMFGIIVAANLATQAVTAIVKRFSYGYGFKSPKFTREQIEGARNAYRKHLQNSAFGASGTGLENDKKVPALSYKEKNDIVTP